MWAGESLEDKNSQKGEGPWLPAAPMEGTQGVKGGEHKEGTAVLPKHADN